MTGQASKDSSAPANSDAHRLPHLASGSATGPCGDLAQAAARLASNAGGYVTGVDK